MGSVPHLLYLLLLILSSTLFFSNLHLMAGSWDLIRHNAHENNYGGFFEIAEGGLESKIEKVSGADENGGMGMLVESFRVLLGLKSGKFRRPYDGDGDHLSSPAPAPGEALPPAPTPLLSRPVHHHAPSPHLKLIIPPPPHSSAMQGRSQNESRKRRIIIAVVVSIGSTFAIAALVVILLCWRSERSRRKRFGRMILVRRPKTVNPLNSTSKVNFDPGPELFYLNSLGTFTEGVSCSKQTCQMVSVLSNDGLSSSPSPETGESSGDPTRCDFHHVSPISVDEILPAEPQSSDDESFHSVGDSHSSSARFSNASEANFSNSSATSSPSHLLNRSPLPDDNSTVSTTTPMKSPTRPNTPNSSPLHLDSQSSPSSPSRVLEWTPTMALCMSSEVKHLPGAITKSLIPTPPTALDLSPPVPSKELPSPSHSSACSPMQMPLVIQDSHTINSSDSLSSASRSMAHLDLDSSSSKETQKPSLSSSLLHPNGSLSSPLQKPSQSLATPSAVPGTTPRPLCPPLPPPQPPLPNGHHSIRPPPPPPLLPPPFLKHRNSIQPPPPPPCLGHQIIAVGKDGAPLPKLKPLHWDKVRATPDRSMVWDKLRSSSFELDEEMIESLFGYNLQNSTRNEELKSKSPSPSKHVLDPKRLQNITILSKALNATFEQVCGALMQGDGLRARQLEALVKMVPTKEEEDKLSNYQGNINELGSAEKFVKAILNIPFAFQRIDAMLYRDTFEDEVIHLRKSFAMLEEACKELRSSRLFLKLLEAVLKTGNRMNVGTIRGGARAFKLDALLKLADVKGTDGKTTLLHFVVQEMIRSEGMGLSKNAMEDKKKKNKNKTDEEWEKSDSIMGLDLVSNLSTELDNVKKTATIDLDVLANSVSNLSEGMVKLRNLVLKDLSTDEKNRSFVHSMKSFLHHAEKDIKDLKEDEDRVFVHVREITEYFHGDISKDEANPLRIFVIVRDFLGMLDRVCKEVRSSRAQSSPNSTVPFHAR